FRHRVFSQDICRTLVACSGHVTPRRITSRQTTAGRIFAAVSQFAATVSLLLSHAHASGCPFGSTSSLPGFECPRDPCAVALTRGAWHRSVPHVLRVAPAVASHRARR